MAINVTNRFVVRMSVYALLAAAALAAGGPPRAGAGEAADPGGVAVPASDQGAPVDPREADEPTPERAI